MVNKGFDDHGGCSGIVGNLLVRDADAIEVMEGLCGLAQGKLERFRYRRDITRPRKKYACPWENGPCPYQLRK